MPTQPPTTPPARLWQTPVIPRTETAAIARIAPFARLATALCLAIGSHAVAASDFVVRDHVGDGVFTAGIEGPATGPDGVLYVVNHARDGTIGRVDADGNTSTFVTLPEGSIGNGIRFAADGAMYVADYPRHNILRIDPATRAVTVFAHLPDAHQPNDIALAPDGTLYASDPDWANPDNGQLWRIDRAGNVHLLETGMGTTNGVEVSPDGRRVYVNESVQRNVWVYDRDAAGALSNKRLLIRFDDHGMDGMRCDADGNLYIARYGAGVVSIVSPAGQLLREVALKGDKPTNVAFGGSDGRQVFVTLQDRGAIETFRADRSGREYGQRPAGTAPAGTASLPLPNTPVPVRVQPLASGAVTHQVQLPAEPGQAPVVVRSIQPDSVVGNYRIDFDALDADGDGYISREEAQANPALADEFNALDTARRGKLGREQLAGWLVR